MTSSSASTGSASISLFGVRSAVPLPRYRTNANRILTDVPCQVCGDHSSGKHYGIFSCDGCAGFFKRSVRREHRYVCKKQGSRGGCTVDRNRRNQCRACRLNGCLRAGMSREAVQHERGPRKATIRRQANAVAAAAAAAASVTAVAAAAAAEAAASEVDEAEDAPPTPPPPQPPQQLPLLTASPPLAAARDELAARLLFLLARWAASVPAYAELPACDRATLARLAWRDLFLLSAAQTRLPATAVADVSDLMAEFAALSVDAGELACLRGLVLFRTFGIPSASDGRRVCLQSAPQIGRLRDQALAALRSHAAAARPDDPDRLGRLLLMLPALASVSAEAIHAAYFRELADAGALESLVVDMFLTGAG